MIYRQGFKNQIRCFKLFLKILILKANFILITEIPIAYLELSLKFCHFVFVWFTQSIDSNPQISSPYFSVSAYDQLTQCIMNKYILSLHAVVSHCESINNYSIYIAGNLGEHFVLRQNCTLATKFSNLIPCHNCIVFI